MGLDSHADFREYIRRDVGAGEMAQGLRLLAASSRATGFHYQHPHGSSHLSVTLALGNLTYLYTYRQNTNAHKINKYIHEKMKK